MFIVIIFKWVYTKAYRWNVQRKWRKSMDYSAGEDAELDEAFLDELERQVIFTISFSYK